MKACSLYKKTINLPVMKNIIFFALLLVLSAYTYKHKSQITLPNTVKRISKAVTINIRGLAPLQIVARSSKIL